MSTPTYFSYIKTIYLFFFLITAALGCEMRSSCENEFEDFSNPVEVEGATAIIGVIVLWSDGLI